jgi:hypothetical protein
MFCMLTAIVVIDPYFELSGTPQAVWFRDGSLPMEPCRCNRVEPRTCAGPWAAAKTHAPGPPLDLLRVLTEPMPHRMAAVPRGIGPAPQQRGAAVARQSGRAPRQTRTGDWPHGAPRDQPQPPLLRLLRPRSPWAPLAGQSLGSRLGAGPGAGLQRIRGVCFGPGRVVGGASRLPQTAAPKPSAQAGWTIARWSSRARRFFFGRRPDRDGGSSGGRGATTRPTGGGPPAWLRRCPSAV